LSGVLVPHSKLSISIHKAQFKDELASADELLRYLHPVGGHGLNMTKIADKPQ